MRGDRGEDRVNWTALDQSVDVEDQGAARGGKEGAARGCAAEGEQMWPSTRKGCGCGPGKSDAAVTVEIHFNGVRGTRGGKGRYP